ncbi:Endonuclease/exonuclease/phosphatase [Glomus cerebriforme]|uniref:Endonuclease/exonuclease/phosphatase n=1 Tax=Glomus cerebriforme TaxID=658196 RepID=A0A397TJ16_9GLOM|nr:Endonuclease/exonuclease/phosphatase [Glomus cerebriforme]
MEEMEERFSLPNPGELLIYDFRPLNQDFLASTSESISSSNNNSTLKVLQWNVERNYCSELILSTLKSLNPDIALIQEIDINCKRSSSKNHFKEIAKELKWKGGFVCEFLELESEVRSERDQGGGLHGNAIFTKHDITFRVLDHKYHPMDWDEDGEKLNEPRKGKRYTLVGEVETSIGPPILCYCVHLEVFCGIIGRISQFSDILLDSISNVQTHPYQLIFGDLNTMGHSIARLSPKFCQDRYRFLSLGITESEWWDKNLFDWHIKDGEINLKLQSGGLKIFNALLSLLSFQDNNYDLEKVTLSGFTIDVLKSARNPGFYDPWSCTNDITFHNPNYFGLFKAKLDWTLLHGFEVVNRWIGNHDYKASDHKYLMVEIKFDDLQDMNGEVWEKRRTHWKNNSGENNENKGIGRIGKWVSFIGIITVGLWTVRLMRK